VEVGVTPAQLRAYAAVARLGSVKRAAADLEVSEAAVSLHVGQLRKELGDRLFVRTASGLAFTPGGLRLASRAAEMLSLQDRTILEVRQDHPMTRMAPGVGALREQMWLLGPAATYKTGVIPDLLRRINVPEDRQRIFQSQAAAVEEAKRGKGLALAVSFVVSYDIANGDLLRVQAPSLQAQGAWSVLTLTAAQAPPAAAELARFVTTPRATQAMLRGSGVTPGRFRPSIHVTLWS
jgi:LysR family transcriptional regulator, low CO2-responsive transcriptional regulator